MSDPTNDIDLTEAQYREADALLRHLDNCYWHQKHAALTALVAERDALKKRVAELETQPHAASDLRERLVCAIWPQIIRQWREYKDAIDPRGCARADALEEADKMIAAMRKGDTNGK